MTTSFDELVAEGWLPSGEMAKSLDIAQSSMRDRYAKGLLERIPDPRGRGAYLYRVKEEPDADEPDEKEAKANEEVYEVHALYVYDGKRYIFTDLPGRTGKKGKLALPKDMVNAICDAYSNVSGPAATINELAAKYHMRRKTIYGILQALGHTHDSHPWTREHVDETSEEDLFHDLTGKKAEEAIARSEKEEWRNQKADARSWQHFETSIIDVIRDMQLTPPPRLPKYRVKKKRDPYKAVILPADLHVMKQCFATGLDLARPRFENAIGQIFEHIECYGPPVAWISSTLGDWSNVDNIILNATTKGTSQRQAGTPHQAVHEAVQLYVDFIEMLRTVAPVEHVEVPGNHDRTFTAVMAAMLAQMYKDTSDVSVDSRFLFRKGVPYGKNFIVLNHGDSKQKQVGEKIVEEFRAEMGQCPHVYIYGGHLHSERRYEYAGMVIDVVPSLSVKDEWEDSKAFTGKPLLNCYLHHPENGRFGQFTGFAE